MYTRAFIGTAVFLNSVLGSFCMMPMQVVMAEAAPHYEEMNMSPMDAMSHAGMEHGQEQQPVGCNGHCIVAQGDEYAIGKDAVEQNVKQGISFAVSLNTTYVENVQKFSSAEMFSRSPRELATATVVIRQ